MPPQPKETPRDAKDARQQNAASQTRAETPNDTYPKLSGAVWGMLFTLAGFIDLVQIGLDMFIIGFVANLLVDILFGLSLAFFFARHDMLDKKLGISLLFGFGVDFLTFGIAPAWLLDIGYAWLVTDGAGKAAALPGIEEKAKEGASKILKALKK